MVGALANLGDLTKPATVLIEKISDAVGGIAKPWQIVRVAEAESRADLIRAESRLSISDMEKRALIRLVREEGDKQKNIEDITAKALPNLPPDAKPENLEKDWLVHFFERCRIVSDGEMQSLWSHILAGEATRPGRFSKKTVELVAVLDKGDAKLFTSFCSFVWMFKSLVPIIKDETDDLCKDAGLSFPDFNHLQDIGLINFNGISSYSLTSLDKVVSIVYYGKVITFEFPGEYNMLPIGKAVLTRAGAELAPICGSKKSDAYFNRVVSTWLEEGHILSCPIGVK